MNLRRYAILLPEKILEKQNKVCTTIGACNEWQFHLQTQPRNYRQEHWDEKCFMCQGFARNLEEHIQLKRYVADKNIKEMVSNYVHKYNIYHLQFFLPQKLSFSFHDSKIYLPKIAESIRFSLGTLINQIP